MRDSTIKKVSEKTAPKGAMGQTYLVSGKHLAMRLWRDEAPQADEPPSRRDYETVGYVIAGRAELNLEGQTIHLAPGDSLARAGKCGAPLPDHRTLHGRRSHGAAGAGARA